MNKYEEPLIHPDTLSCQIDETDYSEEGFVSRHEFTNRTGIYVTPAYFRKVNDQFQKSGVTVAEFLKQYENKYAAFPVEKIRMEGMFKYLPDDTLLSGANVNSEDVYPNIWEIIDNLGCALYALSENIGRKERERSKRVSEQ